MPDQLFFDIVKMVVALACIVGLIFAVVWMLKRLAPGVAGGPAERVPLRVLSQLSLGARQKVAVVRVAERTLVLGVTEGSINTLAELEAAKPVSVKEADDPKIFAELLTWRKDRPEPAAAATDAGGGEPAARPAARPKPVSAETDDGPKLFAPGEKPFP